MIHSELKIAPAAARFSILIPSWNNLPYLQLCVDSIRKNSRFPHQIIIHVSDGSDGTLDWVKEAGLSYTHSTRNIGVCWALNAMRRLVDTEYIVFMNDDMYVCPDWDEPLWREIQSLPDNRFFLSSTVLQPRPFMCPSVIAPVEYGESVASFDEAGLLAGYRDIPHRDWLGAMWPPNVVHRDIWDLVGGYSVEFSPGVGSDPDFAAKLVLAGVRHLKGLSESRVYHFESATTRRVTKNDGSKQFLMKWGITSSTFVRKIVRRGVPIGEEGAPAKLKLSLIRSRVKRGLLGMTGTGGTQMIWRDFHEGVEPVDLS